MALPAAKAAIRARLEALGPSLPLIADNEQGDPPDADAWMFLRFLGSAPMTAGIAASGQHLHREYGSFQVNLFVRAGTGTTEADDYANQIADIFRVQNDAGVFYCDEGMEPRIEENPDAIPTGNWYGLTVTVNFRHDWIG